MDESSESAASSRPGRPDSLWSAQLVAYSVSGMASMARIGLAGDKIFLPEEYLETILAIREQADRESTAVESSGTLASRSTPSPGTVRPFSTAPPRSDRSWSLSPPVNAVRNRPLTFRIVNPLNGRAVYGGVREFSAPPEAVVLSDWISTTLGVFDNDTEPPGSIDAEGAPVSIHLVTLPLGSQVTLIETGIIEAGTELVDWKPVLENLLRERYTTLTRGERLVVPVSGRTSPAEFIIRDFGTDDAAGLVDGVCIIDTDLTIDIIRPPTVAGAGFGLGVARPLSVPEDDASPVPSCIITSGGAVVKLDRLPSGEEEIKLSQMSRLPSIEIFGHISEGHYNHYLIRGWNPRGLHHDTVLAIKLVEESGEAGPLVRNPDVPVELYATPIGPQYQSMSQQDSYVWTDLKQRPPEPGSPFCRISMLNIAGSEKPMEGADGVRLSLLLPRGEMEDENEPDEGLLRTRKFRVTFKVVVPGKVPVARRATSEPALLLAPGPDEPSCPNCGEHVPIQALVMHSLHCARTFRACKECPSVILRSDVKTMAYHWHCRYTGCPSAYKDLRWPDGIPAYGFTIESFARHLRRFHSCDADGIALTEANLTAESFRLEDYLPRWVACSDCGIFQAPSIHRMAAHKTGDCPAKKIICRFCHLSVAQGAVERDIDIPDDDRGLLDPEEELTDVHREFQTVKLSQLIVTPGLTPHEFIDGTRTTDCPTCNEPVRLFDLQQHLDDHKFARDRRLPPGRGICANRVCGAVLPRIDDQYTRDRVDSLLERFRLDNGGELEDSRPAPAPVISASLCANCAGALILPTSPDSYFVVPSETMTRRRIERKYTTQETHGFGSGAVPGCGRQWCRNWACLAGRLAIQVRTGSRQTPQPLSGLTEGEIHGWFEAGSVDDRTESFFKSFAGADLSNWVITSTQPDGIYMCAVSRTTQARGLEARVQVGISLLMNPGLVDRTLQDPLAYTGMTESDNRLAFRRRINTLLHWWLAALEKVEATPSFDGNPVEATLVIELGVSGDTSVDWTQTKSGIPGKKVMQAREWLDENAPSWILS